MLFFMVLACGSAGDVVSEPGDTADPAWNWLGGEVASSAWTATDVEGAVAQAFANGFPGALNFAERYLVWMSYGDDDCPGDPQIIDSMVHVAGCTASTGYRFEGDAIYYSGESHGWDAWYLSADFVIYDPDGLQLGGGGQVDLSVEGSGAWWEANYGTWWDETATNWLSVPMSAGYRMENFDGQVQLSGGVGVGDVDVFFEDFSFEDGCTYGSGSVFVLEPGVGWHRVVLACQSCGTLSLEGVDEGEACLELSALGEELLAR